MTLPHLRASDRLARGLLLLALSAPALPSSARAQIPDKFTNLKVLPKGIDRRDLMATMRGFAGSLGVRCTACHVGKEGEPMSSWDFAADDKAMKRKARVMLRMVREINGQYLANLPDRSTPNVTVTCTTCHRGVRRPEPIDQIVEQTLRDQGIDSAVAQYDALRKEYYGSASYDFTDRPLLELARRLGGAGDSKAALQVLQLSATYNPESAQSYFAIGQIHERAGDKQAAIDAYRKALELAPGFRQAEQRLKALGGGGGA